MILIQLSKVHLSAAGHPLVRDLDWAIGDRARIGLVGANGAGKSSVLDLIAGGREPDAGQIQRRRGLRIGVLAQEVSAPAGATLIDIAGELPPALAEIEAALAATEARLADPEVQADDRALARTLARQEKLLEDFEAHGGPSHRGKVRSLLARFGLGEEEDELRPIETLSGGQRRMVALVALAAAMPDLLLLDEPENHLDLIARQQLEDFLRDFEGSVLVVSHDRYLLDGVAQEIAELEGARLTIYPGTYSRYTAAKELGRLQQQKAYADQQKEIARIEASIKRFELWASMVVNERHIKQARSRRRSLDKMKDRGEIIDAVRDARRMELRLEGDRGSKKALEVTGLSAAFGEELIFVDVDLLLRHGDRVGVVGDNGSGKSVLLKLILGQLEAAEGEVKIGPSTRVGYYSQEHETLSSWLARTPLDLVRDIRPMSEGAGVSFLLRFLFRYEQVRQAIGTLSGGERSRLQLARLMLERPNLLILDEPTNNLDIASSEVLESALEDFDGTLLVVSHDRYFLDAMVDRVAELRDGELHLFDGGYTDYREARRAREVETG